MEEIHAIAVGDPGEYGNRLVRFLEKHVPPSVRVYHFTSPDSLEAMREPADYYLIDRDFGSLQGGDPPENSRTFIFPEESTCIWLSDRKEEDGFCRFDPVTDLLALLGISEEDPERRQGDRLNKSCIAGLYSPVYEENLMKIAMTFMEEGDLYLGFEDLGPVTGKETDVGDLCYYIHIREEHILDILEELCDKSSGIFLLDSPELFFCLRELDTEDYHWFFDRLRASRRYARIFLGMGNGVFFGSEMLSMFDRIILVDSLARERQHDLCGRLKKAICGDSLDFRGEIQECFREEILDRPSL